MTVQSLFHASAPSRANDILALRTAAERTTALLVAPAPAQGPDNNGLQLPEVGTA